MLIRFQILRKEKVGPETQYVDQDEPTGNQNVDEIQNAGDDATPNPSETRISVTRQGDDPDEEDDDVDADGNDEEDPAPIRNQVSML